MLLDYYKTTKMVNLNGCMSPDKFNLKLNYDFHSPSHHISVVTLRLSFMPLSFTLSFRLSQFVLCGCLRPQQSPTALFQKEFRIFSWSINCILTKMHYINSAF